jgi:hypothetical protein
MIKGKGLLVLLTIAAAGASAMAAELDVSLSADFFDKYIWRGQMLGLSGVVQPSVTVGKAGASLNVWGNMPMTSEDPAGKPWAFNELDYTLDYSGEAGIVGYSTGFILYTFPRPVINQPTPKTTNEIYGSVGFDVLLSPSVTVYKDIKEIGGWYINAGIGHSIPLGDMLALDLSASLGWGDNKYNRGYWSGASGGLNDLALTAALPLDVGGGVSVVPSIGYVTIVEGKLRDTNTYGPRKDYLIAGVGVAAEF